LRILINERGGVDDVTVVEAEPRGYFFEDAALEATRALQFSPAMRFGHRVKSRKDLEVIFNPYESINVP
jgi:TonB family protein